MDPKPFPLYHWSPSTRRKQIERRGMVPGSWSPDRAWRPPCICYADSPQLAWRLSGALHPEHPSWDLWMTWSDVPSGFEEIPFDGVPGAQGWVKEYRVYERIFKRDLWYVATRAAETATTAEARTG